MGRLYHKAWNRSGALPVGSGLRLNWRRYWLGLTAAVWFIVPAVWSADLAPATTPEAALKAYRQGRFEESEDQYSALAKEQPEDPRLRFNAGAAAYRKNDLTNASTWFESVLAAPDLNLQQQAYYNLGNTRFRLGEALQDPQGRQRMWQEALTNFTAATKLNQADTKAATNLAFVRQKLEELQQQMPPPQQSQQSQKNKDQKGKDPSKQQQQQQQASGKDGENDPSQPQDPSQKSESGKDPSDEPKPGQETAQQKPQPGDNTGDAQQPGSKDGKGSEKGDATGASPKPGDEAGKETAEAEVGEGKPGEMSAAQAVQLLEHQKGDEKALKLRAYGDGNKAAERAARVRKPW